MTFIIQGNTGLPTVIEMEHGIVENKYNIEDNLRNHEPIFTELIAECLARGNDMNIKCHNGKIFLYELSYQE